MKALALDYEQRTAGLRDVPEPAVLADGEVCVRVDEVGICGTDRDLVRFKFGYPPQPDRYMILGHEAVAEVVATGSAVTGLRPGDVVVPTVRRGCRACSPCLRRRADLCLTGQYVERGIMGAHGFLCDIAVDLESNFVRVDRDARDIAVLAEPLSVVEKAVDRAMAVRQEPAETALVLGAGPIGLLSTLLLRLRGVRVTLQSMEDTESERATLASDAGASFTNRAEGRFDIVIEAAGSAAAAYDGIRRMGPLGVCVLLGAQTGAEELVFRDLILNNQTVLGSVNASPQAFAQAVADLASFDRALLARMIRRGGIHTYASALSARTQDLVKQVLVLH